MLNSAIHLDFYHKGNKGWFILCVAYVWRFCLTKIDDGKMMIQGHLLRTFTFSTSMEQLDLFKGLENKLKINKYVFVSVIFFTWTTAPRNAVCYFFNFNAYKMQPVSDLHNCMDSSQQGVIWN